MNMACMGSKRCLCRAVDIAQPDVGSCGGLTAMHFIAVLAHSFGVEVNPHVWGSSVVQAASVHVLCFRSPITACLPAAYFEYDRSDHPFSQRLVAAPLSLDKGVVTINQDPGLGIDIQQDCIDRYRKLNGTARPFFRFIRTIRCQWAQKNRPLLVVTGAPVLFEPGCLAVREVRGSHGFWGFHEVGASFRQTCWRLLEAGWLITLATDCYVRHDRQCSGLA